MRDRPAVALVVAAIAAAIFVMGRRHRAVQDAPPVEDDARAPVATATIARPPEAVAELGVLTERSEEELARFTDAKLVSEMLTVDECGDACGAVRAFAARALTLDVMPATFWPMPTFEDLPDVTRTLSEADRARVNRPLRLVTVRAAGPGAPDHLPARAAFAAAAAIAKDTGGLVYDRVDDRIETAATFAAHAIVSPIGASAFAPDRIEVRTMARADGTVRLVTSGLLRFGVADLDVASVEPRHASPLADLLTATARALVDGATTSPVDVVVAGARLRVDLVEIHPESGDPSRTMVRVVAGGATTPAAYAALAATIPSDDGDDPTPSEDELDASKVRTQRDLGAVLARFSAERDAGATLLVQFPFSFTGDGGEDGEEWMWVGVDRFDDVAVEGSLADDPENVTAPRRGDRVKRARADATGFELVGPDGRVESGGGR